MWFLYGIYLEQCSDNTDCIQIIQLVCRYMFAFYSWNFRWRTLCIVFIRFIFVQYVVVWIVFIKLTDLVLLCMAPPCVDFAGFLTGGIPAPCFFSFDFLWSLCFSHSLHSLSFSSPPFSSFSDCLVVLFVTSTTLQHLLPPSLTLEEKWKKKVKMYYTH